MLHEDGQATGVVYMGEDGEEVTQPADIVVLSGFTVPNIRMLMLSKIGTEYDPQSGRGTLGRRFTQQTGKVRGGPLIVFDESSFSGWLTVLTQDGRIDRKNFIFESALVARGLGLSL